MMATAHTEVVLQFLEMGVDVTTTAKDPVSTITMRLE